MQNIQILQQIFSPSLWVKFWVWKKPCAHLQLLARGGKEVQERADVGHLTHIVTLLLHCSWQMQTQSSPSLESNLNCFWTAPIVLVGTGSPAKKGQVCFLSIPPCWGKGEVWKMLGCQKSEMGEWRRSANISCGPFQRERNRERWRDVRGRGGGGEWLRSGRCQKKQW